MTRSEFVSRNSIESILSTRGVKVIGLGKQRMAKCPIHDDKQASFSINHDDQIWFCHAGCGSGSVIDLLAKLENKTIPQILKDHGINGEIKASTSPPVPQTIEKIYSYQNAIGQELFQVLRYQPKTFRQRHVETGKLIWGMEGVERVLYRLPEVCKAQTIWIVEGEKDADNLAALGFTATCNVGGAGKWLDAYTESLTGKDVIICGDNDAAGQKHVEIVFDSIAGKVKTARLLKIPAPNKDVSDFIATNQDAKRLLEIMASESMPFSKGIRLPVYSLAEIEPMYQRQVRETATTSLNLGLWLPSLSKIRPLIPGEMACFLADTGTGKSAILQNIAASSILPTLFFEMELPPELLFERFVALKTKMTCQQIETAYRTTDDTLGEDGLKRLSHIMVCPESRLDPQTMESIITRSELKLGTRPVLVLVDYIQLMNGQGNRRERISDAAESLKSIAKATRTIIIAVSQIARPDDDSPEIHLHDGKESGSIENSCGLVVGAWRDKEDDELLHLSILKNSKGRGGGKIHVLCNFNGATMRITERSSITESDIPKQKRSNDD